MSNYPWENLRPNDTLQLVQREWITDQAWANLLALYLPIIGSDAHTLFHTFYQQINRETYQSEVLRHSDLMNMLVWNKETYIRARGRLEALGLLKIYTRKEQFQDPQLLVLLYAPVSRQTFFGNATLSSLLYGAVGEATYQKLLNADQIPAFQKIKGEEWKETTAQFKDVYHLPTHTPPTDTDAKMHITDASTVKIPLSKSGFDRSFFKDYLQQGFLGELAITTEVLDMSETLYQLYGYDEVDLARLAYQAADLRTNTIDVKRYQSLALKAATEPPRTKPETATRSEVSKPNAITSNTTTATSPSTTAPAGQPLQERATEAKKLEQAVLEQSQKQWKEKGLTDDQLALARDAKVYHVVVFARYLKEARGGFLTDKEMKGLNDMVARGHLKPEVINIMTYYYLIEQGNENLRVYTLQSTEDDWSQKKIYSAEDALYYLKERQVKRQEQLEQKRYNKPRRGYQERIPQWLVEQKKGTQTSNQPNETERSTQKKASDKSNANQKNTNQQSSSASQGSKQTTQKQADINQRLKRLMNKGGN
ncbi:MAG: DnaD domain protein [Aerococcus sp.]|nr:DnaD domain protein [Aerococcus sp.]